MKNSFLTLLLLVFSPQFLAAQPIFTDEQIREKQSRSKSERGFSILAEGDISLNPLSVDINSREESRQFYNTIFLASENVPSNWTGNYQILNDDVAAAGDISTAFKEATLLRVNYYRALVGLPGDITFLDSLNADSQLAALTMSGNDAITHYPADGPNSQNPYGSPFPNYLNNTAHVTAGVSNLAIGQSGPDSITGYIEDAGGGNAAAGHRRWILYPPSTVMGTGDAPGGSPPEVPQSIIDSINSSAIGQLTGQRSSIRRANVLHIADNINFPFPRPISDLEYVAYPPPGFVLHQLVFPRWSFSIPGVNFDLATVTMTKNGIPIDVQKEPTINGAGDNTLVWLYDNQSADDSNPHPAPGQDTIYTVTVSNLSGAPQSSYTYNVTVFNPSVPSQNYQISSLSGPTQPSVGQSNQYSAQTQGLGIESGIRWRCFDLIENPTVSEGAENGLTGWSEFSSDNYDSVFNGDNSFVSSGSNSFHLATGELRTSQTLTLNRTFKIGPTSTLIFESMVRLATNTQFAKVQVTIDDGTSWEDVYSQAGLTPQNSSGFPDENFFSNKIVDLSAYEGRTIGIRFAYIHTTGSAFPQVDTSGGWFFDDISIQNVEELTNIVTGESTTGYQFTFTPTEVGPKSLQVQPVAFSDYPMEWGSVTTVSATEGSSPLFSRLINVSTRAKVLTGDSIMIAGFVVEGTETMDIVTRVAGPSLESDDLTGLLLEDPYLTIAKNQTFIGSNDNWSDNSPSVLIEDFLTVGAFSLPNPSADSAHSMSITNGSHTVLVLGIGETTGIALVEVYDKTYRTDPNKITKLKNISTRGYVGAGNEAMIAGFFIVGNKNQRLLIRCAGQMIGNPPHNVEGVIDDPAIYIANSNGEFIYSNDDWETNANLTDIVAATSALNASPLVQGSGESALLVDLAPGLYTVIATSITGSTGVGLLEVNAID